MMGRLLLMPKRRASLVRFHDDPREIPRYSVARAAAYIDVPRTTLRYWLKTPANGRAIIEADPETGELSFYNLLEAHIISVALRRKAWLKRCRLAVDTLRNKYPDAKHPLLVDALHTISGSRNLFAATVLGATKVVDIEDLSLGGQRMLFTRELKSRLRKIRWDETGPVELVPFGFKHIALNYRVSGGRPVIAGTGISVETIASLKRGGEPPDEIARQYGITVADVKEAFRHSTAA